MALQDVFLTPIGLIGLLAVIPILILYLIQPDPQYVKLPTLRFLFDEEGESASNPLLERLSRNLLLLLQLLVVITLATALAGPYATVSESQTVEETVIVIDGSASMAVETEDGTRFGSAIDASRSSTTGTNSIILANSETRILLRSGSAQEAETTLEEVTVSETSTDLGAAISQAASIAGENARIVVFSDFADETGWTDNVQSARARDLRVDLRQFNEGGSNNVGIIDRSFSGGNVTLAVKNYGEDRTTRSVRLGDQTRTIEIGPDNVRRVELSVPPGGNEARITPTDSFPTDNTAYLAAPSDPTIDILLLTNDRSRHLTTALSVIDEVELTVDSPPTTVEDEYDVILYNNLDSERLLQGNVEAGRDVVESGGGVAILAQEDFPERYGDLLLIEPDGIGTNPSIGRIENDELTREVNFPPPEEYHRGSARAGNTLVQTGDGAPIITFEQRGPGRVLYYGYIAESDPFRFNYQYPVFWKRAAFQLAGRESLDSLNRESGTRLQFENTTTIQTPDGRIEVRGTQLDQTGFYVVNESENRIGVSLYNEAESDVDAGALDERTSETGIQSREEERQVPQPLTPIVAGISLLLIIGEVAFLRHRGDL